jgi:hypothetical protein
MLIFDGYKSHVSEPFLVYCWQHKIIPFQLPPHSTHLLQPLDIGIFQPLKHWHQIDIQQTIQYGDCEYSKIDFLNAYRKIRYSTFKLRTVYSAWKKAGLVPFAPEVVYKRLAQYQQSEGKTADITIPEPPKTPTTPKPFQRPPTSRNRPAHIQYLDKRLDDYIDYDIELTPSFVRSWRAYQSTTESKILKSTLIQEREINKAKADVEARRRKEGSGAWVQSHGVITKGMGVDQIQHKKGDLLGGRRRGQQYEIEPYNQAKRPSLV